MIIDKNGKLFGKISIIDLLSIGLLVLALVFVVKKTGLKKSLPEASLDKLDLEFKQLEVQDYVAENVKAGDPSVEVLNNVLLGEVKEVKTSPSVVWPSLPYAEEGETLKPQSKEGYVAASIRLESQGRLAEDAIEIGGSKFYIGQTINLRVGNSIFYGEIVKAEKH